MRDRPVAAEKKTALMASRRRRAAGASGSPGMGLRDGRSRVRCVASSARGGTSRLRERGSGLCDRVPRLRGGGSPSREVTSRVPATSRRFLMPARGRYSRPPPRREVAAVVPYGQHRLTRKAHPPGGAGAVGEPPLHLVDQDVLPSPGGRGGGRRRRHRRRGAPRAHLARRPRREAPRPAPQQRRAQEGARSEVAGKARLVTRASFYAAAARVSARLNAVSSSKPPVPPPRSSTSRSANSQ